MNLFTVFRRGRKVKTAADEPTAETTTPEAAPSDAPGKTPAEAGEPGDTVVRAAEAVEIPRQQSVTAAADNGAVEGAHK